MKKTRLLVIIVAALILLSVIGIFLFRHYKNNSGSEQYFYDSVDPQCNYSENTVLYFDNSEILHLIDTDTGKDIVYCDRPNCTHEPYSSTNPNPTCPAAFWGMPSGTVIYNEHLYFIGNMTEDDFGTQYLYEMDSNGENRKIAAEIEDVQFIRFVLYRDNYVIGAYQNSSEIDEDGNAVDETSVGVFVIDLNDYKVYKADKISKDYPGLSSMCYEDGNVYYLVTRFEGISEEKYNEGLFNGTDLEKFLYENMQYEIYCYDISKKKSALVNKFDHVNYLEMLDGNAYYLSDGDFFEYDKKTDKTKELETESDIEVFLGGVKKQGDSLYYVVSDSSGNEEIGYRIRNGKTTELFRVPSGEAPAILAICGNSVYVNYTAEDGNLCLGVLKLDEYEQGKINIRKLRNYNE